ncbi:DsrE family protein [Desulfobaculum bizertense]|uniref:tRNA 2-thiouridine synthesizing protein D n=1 Tax=Desulfobaculum bizertense DSM 18034 TaxID=1121442 RepID=A0A1T4VR44_9BACT|nr:DsrE family protein [Desulfobaculum bizertense]UIJ38304.1 DsrE family protein [Desulfobaculum bizertense]SKA67328.1 tRNA 2-thiouridine synthesizing protein D [Desulfobaculum bizertense DSM 18034]
MATLTMVLLSGAAENEDSVFATSLAEAALNKGHKVQMYLFGNGVNLSKQEIPIEGDDLHIAPRLLDHIEPTKVSARLGELTEKGADISTCHTNEHARGIESRGYDGEIKWGDVGGTFSKYLMTTDVLLTVGH